MGTIIKTDFHTHILPGIDDGPSDVSLSLRMLDALNEQDVGSVVLTPHFYTDNESLENFFKRRKASYDLLCEHRTQNTPNLILGAEVYLTKYLFNNEDISSLFIGTKKCILIELPDSSNDFSKIYRMILNLIDNYSAVPVIAHVERYPYLIKNIHRLNQLADDGCFFQLNLSSLYSSYFKKRYIQRLLNEGLIHIVSTDCHDLAKRPPNFSSGMSFLAELIGDSNSDAIMQNAADLL